MHSAPITFRWKPANSMLRFEYTACTACGGASMLAVTWKLLETDSGPCPMSYADSVLRLKRRSIQQAKPYEPSTRQHKAVCRLLLRVGTHLEASGNWQWICPMRHADSVLRLERRSVQNAKPHQASTRQHKAVCRLLLTHLEASGIWQWPLPYEVCRKAAEV